MVVVVGVVVGVADLRASRGREIEGVDGEGGG